MQFTFQTKNEIKKVEKKLYKLKLFAIRKYLWFLIVAQHHSLEHDIMVDEPDPRYIYNFFQ